MSQQKKWADPRVNLKESEKRDKYLDLAREVKKIWDMKVAVMPIRIDGSVQSQKD